MTTVGGIGRSCAARWEKLRRGQFANIIRTKTFGKGRKDILSNYAASAVVGCQHHEITLSRNCTGIHLLARTLSIRRGTMYQNEERKWRRIEVDNRGNGEREFVEFVCLRIFDKRKKGKREIIGGIIGEEREKRICRIHFACFFHLL